jgi:RNA polymerase sigma factor (sigma-70 family)
MTATATLPAQPSRVVAWSRLGDDLLAGRAAGGNSAAFTALYERYYGPLLGYTRSILLDAEDARDATQNALESALRALPGRDTDRPLRPWLYKIAHNEAIDIMRRRRPQTEMTPALEPLVDGPEVSSEQRGRLAELVDDLRTLPERQRGALVMRELNGLSYDEIGQALGLSNEAARRAVFDARNALHDAVDGRATECTSVRHSISDGDRRSLRARGIRAHLRSCDDCASFQRSIGTRRADLHLLAPWLSGAAVMGAIGAGGAGGGALLAGGGGGAAAASGGISWTGLPLAVKGLAVAAAVATTGTAAVEIKHVAKPSPPATASRAAEQRSVRADALAMRAATLAQRSATRARTPATPGRSHRVRVTSGTSSSSVSTGRTTSGAAHRNTPALAPPITAPAPSATKPSTSSDTTSKATTPAVVKTPEQKAIEKLAPLRDAIAKAFANAQALAASGTQGALSMATGLLDRTLGPLTTSINRILAPFGMKLPVWNATSPASTPTSKTNVLASVQQVLSGVQNLLQKLLGRR